MMSKPIILCVDDEKIILDSLKRQLKENFGKTYSYEFADSAEEAQELIEELLEEEQLEILLIVSDWLMPGKKGDEFLIEVHNHYPNIIKMMLTGQADENAVKRAEKQANLHVCLRKPWNEEDLVNAIRSAVE
jgi:CheY-like chemotaxis protein